jgi:uncharacterized protein (TIGR02302 family)
LNDRRRSVLGSTPQAAAASTAALPLRVRFFVFLAWALLFAERLLTALWPAILVLAGFLAVALFGLLRLVPAWPQLALLVLVGIGFLAALWFGFRRFRLPSSGEAVRRVERDSNLEHRPITHLNDTQASNLIDPGATALWKLYRAKLISSIGRLAVALPRGTLVRRDPWGLRVIAILALVIAGYAAGDHWQRRLAQALHPNFSALAESETAKVEAWLTPPDYTRLAPISLSSVVQQSGDGDGKPIQVPAGSKLLAQAEGVGAHATLVANGESKDFETLDPMTQRIEGKIKSGDEIEIRADGQALARWPITVVPDRAPTVAFAAKPTATDRGVLRLDYAAKDDYGIANVRAVIQLRGETLELNLPLPQIDGRDIKAFSYQDLTAHPWSGLDVEMRLVARDDLGQIGASAPIPVTLPERKFFNPVARAIIEQRKKLVRNPDSKDSVAEALRGIDSQPEAFDGNISVFLALNLAWRQLSNEEAGKADIASVVQLLWDTALALEDGGTSIAMRELRELQRQLQEALNRGASQEEIARLMNQLQEAMNKYLQSLQDAMRQAAQNGQPMRQLSPNTMTLSKQDLNQMLNEARRMAQSGSRDSAQQMLNRLQQMLENLQAGIPMPGRQGNQAQQMLNDLGRMMQRQQDLLQQSFQLQRGQQSGDGQSGQKDGNQSGQGQEQAGQQDLLRRDLGQLMRQFGNVTGDLPQGMGQAEQSMRGAVQALNGGDYDRATEQQNQALSQMQQGLQSMQQMLQRQAGTSNGPGQRDKMDPFGRSANGADGNGPDASDTSKGPDLSGNGLDRARDLFEELRQRRNDPSRPRDELDYLDRLLKQF